MKTYLTYIFAFLCLTNISGIHSQSTSEQVHSELSNLKAGTILIRLSTESRKMIALRHQGKENEAIKLQLENEQTNNSIINAVKKHYKFSHYYFFYDTNSNEILNKNLSSLLDSNLQNTVSFIQDSNLYIMDTRNAHDYYRNRIVKGVSITRFNLSKINPPFPSSVFESRGFFRAKRTKEEQIYTLNQLLNQ